MEANSVGDEEWKNWLAGIQEEIRNVADRKSAKVAKDIEAVRRDVQEKPQPVTRLGEVSAQQRQIERDLRSLVLRLTEHGDISQLIQLLRTVRNREAMVRDQTRALIRPGGSGEPQK